MPNFTLQILILFICIGVFAIACVLWMGAPKTPPVLQSIDRAFGQADYRGAKDINVFESSAGQLAYRHYAPEQNDNIKGSVILIHGSSATSISMHNVAKYLANAGFSTYALDMRGHGDSGVKGHIDKIGRLESDIIDFLDHIQPSHPRTLAGFRQVGVLPYDLRSARMLIYSTAICLYPHSFIKTHQPKDKVMIGQVLAFQDC